MNNGQPVDAFEDRFFFDGTREIPTDEYVEAYVEGAQAVWAEVEDTL